MKKSSKVILMTIIYTMLFIVGTLLQSIFSILK